MKIFVIVKPRSRLDKIEKTEAGYIAYLKEKPVENRANRALLRLLSEYFDIPQSRIEILSGMKSKKKIIEIQ